MCHLIFWKNKGEREGSTYIFGKTRFGERGLPKSPIHRGNFQLSSEVSMLFALRAMAAPVNGRRLELNLIMHPTHTKSNLYVR